MPTGVYFRTKKHRENLAEATKKSQFKKGQTPWNKGKKWKKSIPSGPNTTEWRRKLSEAKKGKPSWNKGICGSKSHSWQGGKSHLTNRIRVSSKYKKWRADVFRRDGWTCQTCGFRGHGRDIEAHHIIPMFELLEKVSLEGVTSEERYLLSMEISELFDVSNGVTLCRDCHILTHKGDSNEN